MNTDDITLERPATWLEVVRSGHSGAGAVAIHPIADDDGKCMAVSLGARPLCSNDGRITIFEDLAAAVRFLSVAGVRTWNPGVALKGVAAPIPGAERLRLRNGQLTC